MKIKILFQGDSVTDAGRNREDFHYLGNGYPRYVAPALRERFPEDEFEFINLGMSGNRAEHLLARWKTDAVDINPDIISILIGVNDCWFFEDKEALMPEEYFEYCYRSILEDIKNKTHAKIIMLEPFLLDAPGLPKIHEDVERKKKIVYKLADEYADAFLKCQCIFDEASADRPPMYWAEDGIHTTHEGAVLLAEGYTEAAIPLIEQLH